MYRDDWDAAIRRANALEGELKAARGREDQDQARIAQLEAQLDTARRAIENLRATHPQGGYPQPGYPQPGYQQVGYGVPGPYYPGQSNATTVLVLGILSLVLCQICGPFAWHYGNQELQRIQAGEVDPRRLSEVQAGRVLGIVGTVMMVLGILFFFVVLVAAAS